MKNFTYQGYLIILTIYWVELEMYNEFSGELLN